jgi:hypothetical protein
MAFSVNDNGTWKTVKKLSVNDGTWKAVKSGWINKNGVWTKFYASDITAQVTVVGGGGGTGGYCRRNCDGAGMRTGYGGNGGGAGASIGNIIIPSGESLNISVGGSGGNGANGNYGQNFACGYAGSPGASSSISVYNIIATGGGGGGGGTVTQNPYPDHRRCTANNGAPGAGGTASGGSTNTSGSSNGTSGYPPYGNAGASGAVIIKVPSTTSAATTTGTVSVTTVGSETVYTFTSSGTIAFN